MTRSLPPPQTSLDIGYLGPEGTYAHEAASLFVQRLQLQRPNLIPVDPLEYLLYLLAKGEVDSAVVPLRNTIAGDYKKTVEGLMMYPIKDIDHLEMRIILALGIHPDTDNGRITEVQSYSTALDECSDYLRHHFPGANQVTVNSTARGMKNIAEHGLLNVAAVGSEFGVRFYGLNLVDNGIENSNRPNTTNFLYLVKIKLGAK